MTTDQTDVTVKRRKFLKGVSALGVGALAPGQVAGKPGDDQIRFIEVGMRHTLVNPEDAEYLLPEAICSPTEYRIDEADGTLHVDSTAISEEERSILENRQTAVYSRGFRPDSAQVAGSTTRSLVTNLSPKAQPDEGIQLAQEYTEPSMHLSAKDEVVVSTDATTENLGAGYEAQHRFGKQNVTARMEEPEGCLVKQQDEMKPWQRAQKMRTWQEQIPVRPEINVRNYGVLTLDFE